MKVLIRSGLRRNKWDIKFAPELEVQNGNGLRDLPSGKYFLPSITVM